MIPTVPVSSPTVSCCGSGWFDSLTSIPKSIVKFFVHRHADVRMLIRSYQSMTGVPQGIIQQRIDEVKRFIPIVENCGENRTEVKEGYLRLSPEVRNLFYTVDEGYIDEFVKEASNTQDILRECNRVIEFQRLLIAVNAFFRRFNAQTEAPEAPIPTLPTEPTRPREPRRPRVPDLPRFPINWMEMLFAHPQEEPPRTHHVPAQPQNPDDDPNLHYWWTDVRDQMNRAQAERSEAPRSSQTVRQDPPVNLNIAGTAAYVRDAIPADVQRKANQIGELVDQFEQLQNKPAVPAVYMCNITQETFMKIPVFDASHPNVNSRDFRHYSEKDALEYYIRTKTHRIGTPQEYCEAKCPVCRHPEHGGIRRQYLRIDTEMQGQILQFLRNAVSGA